MTRLSICVGVLFAGAIALADDKKEEKDSGPVKWSAAFEPTSVKPGGQATLKLTATIEDGWHIYAVDKPTGVSKKTSFKLSVSDKLTPDKAWKIPKPILDPKAAEETHYYDKEVVFTRKIRAGDAEGAFEANTIVEYMVCNEETCLPPKKIVVKATLKAAK